MNELLNGLTVLPQSESTFVTGPDWSGYRLISTFKSLVERTQTQYRMPYSWFIVCRLEDDPGPESWIEEA